MPFIQKFMVSALTKIAVIIGNMEELKKLNPNFEKNTLVK